MKYRPISWSPTHSAFLCSFALSELLSQSGPRTAASRNPFDLVPIKMGVTGKSHWRDYVWATVYYGTFYFCHRFNQLLSGKKKYFESLLKVPCSEWLMRIFFFLPTAAPCVFTWKNTQTNKERLVHYHWGFGVSWLLYSSFCVSSPGGVACHSVRPSVEPLRVRPVPVFKRYFLLFLVTVLFFCKDCEITVKTRRWKVAVTVKINMFCVTAATVGWNGPVYWGSNAPHSGGQRSSAFWSNWC